ncbi:hypothetical protein NLU13_3809 [Sarocladium strictum]|uniref:Rad60/SUMO-like domain-containing protein n=1 Tax=Sarocladium strictum TaxID=5046 RepID=A0AA39GHR4_SARSR|nr:hypothetical protein NLU13_3809 [Sarocladium strictum]
MAEPMSPPKKKKLPFKPTALRRTAAPTLSVSSSANDLQSTQDLADGAQDLDLFKRGKEMAPRLAEELERRLKKKEQQARKEDIERRRSSGGEKRPYEFEEDEAHIAPGGDTAINSPVDEVDHIDISPLDRTHPTHLGSSDPTTPPPSKRSRNTEQKSFERFNSHFNPAISLSHHNTPIQVSPFTRATRTTRSQMDAHPPPEATAIVLSDSDSDSEQLSHAVKPPPGRAPRREASVEIIGVAEDDEDEFNEYVLKAAAARARLQEQATSSTSNNNPTSTSTDSSKAAAPASAEILVTSSIPGSVACKARVRYDQSLRLLRDSWAAKQRKAGLDMPESTAILTWRRARVYNTSTLFHLGLRPSGNGRIAISESSTSRASLSRTYSAATDDGLSDDRTHIHFEAWTQATFTEMERQEASRHDPQPSSPLHDSHPSAEEEAEEEIKLRIILRARGLDDVRLTVRPATTAETLITGWRAQLSSKSPEALQEALKSNPMVTLWFDGEQLEEHVTLDEAEITDMDSIEVHLKSA